MSIADFVVFFVSVGMVILDADVVSGQNYPNKPIRVMASEAGSGADWIARQIAQGISGPLGQPVIVDNRANRRAEEIVAKTSADGYTVLVTSGGLWIGPLLQSTPYDAVKDFSPITLADTSPNVLVVHPSVPVKSVKEMIAFAKARPGELNYAMSVVGASQHLAAELFKSMAGVNIVRVGYSSGQQIITDMIGGRVQVWFPNMAVATPLVKSGRLRALAVTSAEPSGLAPGLPTVAASGLTGFTSELMHCLFVPAGTPRAIINRLNSEVVRVLKTPEAKEKFLGMGLEIVGSSPEQFAAAMKSDIARMGKVIKDAGIRIE